MKTINRIQSDLLYLTPVTKDDADLFVEIYTDPQIMQHVGPALNYDAAMILFNQCLEQITSKQPKNLFYVIKSTHTDEKFGIIGLMWNQPKKTSVELGVMIALPYINKAYAYKATNILVQHVFTELDVESIVVTCNESNVGANRVSRALGFENKNTFVDKNTNQRKIDWKITAAKL